ncbi:DNA-processing protein DprA [Luteimonas sp. FXH3W]|uniref:DNA-processing protein DprA n=1 Tax=Aquilutibacter rugosus TaxID=3115820 RepID=A0ABU7UY45_9GAMM
MATDCEPIVPKPDHAETVLRILRLRGAYSYRQAHLMDTTEPPDLARLLAATPGKFTDPHGALTNTPEFMESLAGALRWLEHPNHHLITCRDPCYPPLLKRANGPLGLFVDGEPLLLQQPSLAVIGSRNPSVDGIANTRDFVRALTTTGLGIVSGLAAGIDSVAHREALDCEATTIAVVGTGPDVAYPLAHRALQEQIAAAGAVVTEQWPGSPPRREHFPARNRIIAGLSLATLVMESAIGSGTVITAEAAANLGRDVFTVPGNIHNPLYRGNHALLRGGAILVQSAEELLPDLNFIVQGALSDLYETHTKLVERLAPAPFRFPLEKPLVGPDYYSLWGALGETPRDMGTLSSMTGLTTAKLSVMLMELVTLGQVIRNNGRYRLSLHPTAPQRARRGT